MFRRREEEDRIYDITMQILTGFSRRSRWLQCENLGKLALLRRRLGMENKADSGNRYKSTKSVVKQAKCVTFAGMATACE